MSLPISARKIAWEVLNQLDEHQTWAETILPRRLQAAGLSEVDERFCRELIFGTIKARLFLDTVLQSFFKSGRQPQVRVLNLLRLGAYQLLLLSKVPAHAAVHATVELAKAEVSPEQSGFVNAVLRALSRTGAPPLPDRQQEPASYLSIRYSFPLWLVRRWVARYGEEAAERLLAEANEAPPLVARVNLLQGSREQALARWAQQGIQAEPLAAPAAVRLEAAGDPARLTEFGEGKLYYQDEASQWLGYLADPPAGGIVLDLCSAPGGKTTQLAELMGNLGRVVAYDLNRAKLQLVRDNARRLKLTSIQTVTELPAPHLLQADRVLVDAPCSGLGTLRRHAEGRWRVQEEDLARLAKTQAGLLEQAARYVKSGGDLIYSTCTTEPEENEQVVAGFLAAHPEFTLSPGPGSSGQPASAAGWGADGYFRTFPNRPGSDGIFAARLKQGRSGHPEAA